MEIITVEKEEDFVVNFETKVGWFKAIRSNRGWYFYFGQEYLGTFTSVEKCQEYLEKYNGKKTINPNEFTGSYSQNW